MKWLQYIGRPFHSCSSSDSRWHWSGFSIARHITSFWTTCPMKLEENTSADFYLFPWERAWRASWFGANDIGWMCSFVDGCLYTKALTKVIITVCFAAKCRNGERRECQAFYYRLLSDSRHIEYRRYLLHRITYQDRENVSYFSWCILSAWSVS